MGPRLPLSFCACKTAWLAPEILVSMGPSPHLRFLHAKQRHLDQLRSLYGTQTTPVVLCIQNSVISTRNTSLYGSQTSPVIFCMENSMPSIRIISLNGSQPSSAVFACETATFGPEQQVSKGPRHPLSFCACKTAWLAPVILVSMGPSPHLRSLHAKQRHFSLHADPRLPVQFTSPHE